MISAVNSDIPVEDATPEVEKPTIQVEECTKTINQIGVQSESPLAWSDDGTQLAYVNGTHGITILVKNAQNLFAREKVLNGCHQKVSQVLFHPSGETIVACGADGIFVWDLNTCELIKVINEATERDANEGEVECICWLYNGTILASGGRDASIKIFDVSQKYKLIESITAHKSSVNTIVFCLDKHYLASAGRDSSIHLYDVSSLSPENIEKRKESKGIVCPLIAAMDGHLGDVSTLAISKTGEYLFSGARDNTIRVWDIASHSCIREVKDQTKMEARHKGDISNLFCLNEDANLASFSHDGTMHIYQLGAMEVDSKTDGDLSMISMDELLRGFTETETEKVVANDNFLAAFRAFPNDGISCTTFNTKFPLMAMSSDHNNIRLYDISRNLVQPTLIQEFTSHTSTVTAVKSLGENRILSVSEDYAVSVYDTDVGIRFFNFNTDAAMYTACHNEDLLFAAGKDYVIHVFSMNRTRYYQGMEQSFMVMNQAPPKKAYELMQLSGHAGKIRSMAFSKCNSSGAVFSAGEDGCVTMHKLPEFSPVDPMRMTIPMEEADAVVTDHNGIVLGVAASDEVDGNYYVASVGNDYALFVYRVNRSFNQEWNQASAHEGVISAVTFGHANTANIIFTGGWDAKVYLWDVHSGKKVKELTHHTERITDICVSQDGKWLITSAADKSILLYDIQQDYKVVVRYYTMDECMSICFGENTVVAGYTSGVIRVWPLYAEEKKAFFKTISI